MLSIALGVGFGLSYYALSNGRLFGAFQSGPWSGWTQSGTASPDPYTRAFVARNAALQLGKAEGLQLVASNDSDGRPLDRACRYRVDGRTPTATFWTLIPIDAHWNSIARPDGPPGFHSARVARSDDGSLQLYFSKTLSPLNWVEIAGDGAFSLVLTLYDTAFFSGVGTNETILPSIIRESCR
ncbi:MAG: DUF1214 domain-containing protein [Devosia sp.]